MKISRLAEALWGNQAKFRYLMIAAVIMLFTLLGSREIWTQEHRWADIVTGMFFRHDFLHPYLGQATYYDKPLLSYWLIVIVSKVTGTLSAWTLRVPSALAGLLAIWSIVQLGTRIKDRQLGMLSGWLLLTTYFFVYWARISSADMLNMAGSLFAVAWYYNKKEQAGFFDYAVFFLILSVTSLCKGLGGAIVPLIAVLVDISLRHSWRQHLRLPLFLALIPALLVYIAPFIASSYYDSSNYGQNGLYLVYKENVLRYFQPFDHKGPLYTYFLYLPIYMLPWIIFFIPALFALKRRFRNLSIDVKWVTLTTLALFLFFTISGSRRSYYVLPIVPFAILMTADWLLSVPTLAKRQWWTTLLIPFFYLLLLVGVDLLPAWYYAQGGVEQFAIQLKERASQQQPWNTWNIVTLDAESKLDFYLQLPPNVRHYETMGDRDAMTKETVVKIWPVVTNKPPHTIFVTRQQFVPILLPYFNGYELVTGAVKIVLPFSQNSDKDVPAAFIPIEKKS